MNKIYIESMNKLSNEKRAQVIALLVEGNSLRATSRLAQVNLGTVTKLLVDLGEKCLAYQNKAFNNLPCKKVQVDEIWSFVYAKQKNAAEDLKLQGAGDIWTWTAICADSKLVMSWMIGNRGVEAAKEFMEDVSSRVANRIQLTSDGHRAYLEAVENAFGRDVDYAMLVKIYGNTMEGQKRYSPASFIKADKAVIAGNPDKKHISTSFAERQNLTMRMSMRRFTRLTNGFSKKVENHNYMVALHFMNYNFCRIHKSLRVTPAMAAGVSDHVWSFDELVSLLG